MASLVSTQSFGGPASDPHLDLMMPSGSTVRLTTDEDLRRQFGKLGIEGAHTKPRNQLVEAYAAMLKRIHDDAGRAAVDAFLQSKRD
jgi:hypothetical protein